MLSIDQLFYVSRATRTLDAGAVQQILQISRRNNRRLDVTGCLLYSGHCFAQVLEGREDVVQPLARRIAADPRHQHVTVLLQRRGSIREYGEWSMGYLHDTTLGDALEALLVADAPPAGLHDILARMRPDTLMGALG